MDRPKIPFLNFRRENMTKFNININTGMHSIEELDYYYSLLESMKLDLEEEEKKDYLKLSYLLICAATLEYTLNSIYIMHVNLKYDAESNKEIAECFVGQNFKTKLQIAPVIISDNKFKFRKDNNIIKSLNELILKRNKILHNKSYFTQLNMNNDGTFEIKSDLVSKIDKKKCLEFGNALKIYLDDFIFPSRNNSLKENDLLVKIL